MDEELKDISDKLSKIEVILGSQHEILKDHIRRTELLEQAIKPLTEHVIATKANIKTLAWIVGILIAAATAWWTRHP